MAMTPTEICVKVVPELSEDLKALLGTATEDTIAKLEAGAALAYAIYHCPRADVEAFFKAMPQGVVKAYAKACSAYGIGSEPAEFVRGEDKGAVRGPTSDLGSD